RQTAADGRVPVGVPRAGNRVRGGPGLPAGRRLPLDRLERLGPDGASLREDLPRGAGGDAAARGRSVRLAAVRPSLHQGRPRRRSRRRAGARRRTAQRPRGSPHLRGHCGVRRPAGQGASPRAPGDPRPGRLPAARPGDEPRRGVALRRKAPAASLDRRGAVRFPRRGMGGPAGPARRAPRRRGRHGGRRARSRAARRGLGGHGGCGDRAARRAGHEPRPDPHAGPRRRGAAAAGARPEARSGPRGSRRPAHQRYLRRPPASRLLRARAQAQAMNRRYRTPRRHVPRGAVTGLMFAALGVVASWRLGTGQGGGVWQVRPAEPTVGDTISLEAVITVPGGWGLRAGKLEPTERLEPLGDPALRRTPGGGGWLVRYPVVAWSPGAHTVALPLMWRLAPDGRADSVPGGNATVLVRSVIPDSVRHPEPRGAIAPLRSKRRGPLAPVGATLLAGLLLAAALKWRRRPPRELPPAPRAPRDPE